jgi:hypothetical protein
MNYEHFRFCVAFLLLASFSVESQAFWWLLRAAGTRTVAGTAARGAGAAATVGTGETLAMNAARFCIRPKGAATCDFRAASSGAEAVANAVGSGYRVRPTSRPTLFEVLDAAGNVVSLVEALSNETHPEIDQMQQHEPRWQPQITYGESHPSANVAPLRHNGEVLNIHINGTPTVIWSDGHIEVWADGPAGRRVVLSPGQRLSFPAQRVVHAVPRSSDAYSLYYQPTGEPPARQAQQPPPSVFPMGSNVSCPQIPIGNGMARCQ